MAEIPRPQTAAVTNLLLSHCFHGDGGAVPLSCRVEGRYRGWGEGLGRRSRWWVERRGNVREEKGESGGGVLLLLEQREHEEARRTRLLALSA